MRKLCVAHVMFEYVRFIGNFINELEYFSVLNIKNSLSLMQLNEVKQVVSFQKLVSSFVMLC